MNTFSQLITTWRNWWWSHTPTSPISLYVPIVVWAGMIFWLSSQSILPGFVVSISDFLFKKTAHMGVYAVLYMLIWRATRATTPFTRLSPQQAARRYLKLWLLPLVLTIAYAITDELHQSTVMNRYATARDVGFDMLGAFIALLHLYGYV